MTPAGTRPAFGVVGSPPRTYSVKLFKWSPSKSSNHPRCPAGSDGKPETQFVNVWAWISRDPGAGKFFDRSSRASTQSRVSGAVKLWLPVTGNTPILVATPVRGLNHQA